MKGSSRRSGWRKISAFFIPVLVICTTVTSLVARSPPREPTPTAVRRVSVRRRHDAADVEAHRPPWPMKATDSDTIVPPFGYPTNGTVVVAAQQQQQQRRAARMRIVNRIDGGAVAQEEWIVQGEAASGFERVIAPQSSVFVSFASYRDEECLPTIVDMYRRAGHPERLFVGLVDQRVISSREGREHNDVACFDLPSLCAAQPDSTACQYAQNVRILHVPHQLAKGPTFGRYMADRLRRNETFFLMIDSHCRFTFRWDVRARNQLLQVVRRGYDKPVLSHYPEAWFNPNDSPADRRPRGRVGSDGIIRPVAADTPSTSAPPGSTALQQPPHAATTGDMEHRPLDGRRTTPFLCKAAFLQTGIPRLDGEIVHVLAGNRARRQPFAAAGFLFTLSWAANEVPFDPHLDYLFDGEEILYSIRLWTHGWELFSPGENIVFHYYYRRRSKKVFVDQSKWQVPQLRSIHRVQHLLKLHPVRVDVNSVGRIVGVPAPGPDSRVFAETKRYGLGANRTLQEYWSFAGGDPIKRVFTKNWCKDGLLG